jgi:DmsE family decaheme c-type cytochrome
MRLHQVVLRLLTLALAGALASSAAGQSPGDFAGDASCVGCHTHEDVVQAFQKAVHQVVIDTPLSKGCEMCHGPSKAHADEPKDLVALRAVKDAPAQRCFVCHSNVVTREAWEKSELARAGKKCLDCHRIHEDHEEAAARFADLEVHDVAGAASIAKPIGSAACLGCHGSHGESLRGTGHEKLGLLGKTGDCESCHGAGSLHVASRGRKRLILEPRKATRDAEQAACLKCHQKVVDASHFVGSEFDRAGLRCTTCHEIHRGPAAEKRPPPFDSLEIAKANATFVGTDVCAACHAQAVTEVASTVHAPLLSPAKPGAPNGCEACHGPGSVHVKSAGRKGTILVDRSMHADVAARPCLDCHESNPHVHEFRDSAHAKSDVTCVSCHPVAAHGRRGPPVDQPKTCATCHPNVVSEFALPNHHPLPEGAMNCSSCHAVHERVSMIHDRRLKREACVGCHPQYDGPFVFAHEADRLDGCTACHVPHGSPNRRLFLEREVRTLCLACHPNTPPSHEQRPGSLYRRCLDCHTEIHGSDVDRLFLR